MKWSTKLAERNMLYEDSVIKKMREHDNIVATIRKECGHNKKNTPTVITKRI